MHRSEDFHVIGVLSARLWDERAQFSVRKPTCNGVPLEADEKTNGICVIPRMDNPPHAAHMTSDNPTEPDRSRTPPGVINTPDPIRINRFTIQSTEINKLRAYEPMIELMMKAIPLNKPILLFTSRPPVEAARTAQTAKEMDFKDRQNNLLLL